MILAHGGTAGLLLELAILVVPAMIVFALLRRASKRDQEDEQETPD